MATAIANSRSSAQRSADAAAPAVDTTIRIVTPERITFQYPLAGPGRRACAYLVDFTILAGLTIAGLFASSILTLGSDAGIGLFFVFQFALSSGYAGACEALLNGQTPGKKALGIRVISADGIPITGAQAMLRNLLWSFDGFWPFGYLPAIASMLLTQRFQRLGDLAAGTIVVVEERPPRGVLIKLDEPEVLKLLPWLPARVEAGPELSRALADYVKRRPRLSLARREEIAAHLALPLRLRYDLPPGGTHDAVVCALYHRVFLGD